MSGCRSRYFARSEPITWPGGERVQADGAGVLVRLATGTSGSDARAKPTPLPSSTAISLGAVPVAWVSGACGGVVP